MYLLPPAGKLKIYNMTVLCCMELKCRRNLIKDCSVWKMRYYTRQFLEMRLYNKWLLDTTAKFQFQWYSEPRLNQIVRDKL